MTERNSEKYATPQEQEPKPKVLVTFLGMQHFACNLEFISTLESTLTRSLNHPVGKKVIYYETSDIKDSEIGSYRRLQKQYGGLANVQIANYLRLKQGLQPSPQLVADYRQKLDSEDLSSIVEKGLLPLNNHLSWTFYLYRSLENLQRQYNLELINESHSGPTVNRTLAITKESDREILAAFSAWGNKSFDESVGHVKRSVQLDNQQSRIRDLETVDFLKKKVKSLAKESQGASIVIIFGAAHATILEEVQRKLGPDFQAGFELVTLNSIGTTIKLCLNKGETASDELYSRYLAERIMFNETYQALIKTGKSMHFAKNYEKLLSNVDRILFKLSIQELRRLCEGRINLFEFLKNHPQAGPINELLS